MATVRKPGKPRKAAAGPAAAPPVGGRKKPAQKRLPNGRMAAFEPTDADRQLVMLCAAIGMTQEQTARQVRFPDGIAVETLVAHFAVELRDGADRMAAAIAGNLANIARDKTHPKSVTAAIFWLKARRGWRDADGLKVEVPKGGDVEPFEFTIKIGEAAPKG